MKDSNRETPTADYYDNPLIGRYASPEMSALWGPQRKFSTWRRLWVALAEAEADLGVAITPEQIQQLRQHVDDVDFAKAAEYERKLRHDVMAHVHAYGDACPDARAIIHLGATSCYVTDNTDLILMREGLDLVRRRLVGVIDALATFAEKHRDLPCLAFTHLQPAQPTTVGKRACLWAYDLVMDLEELEFRESRLKARGAKGTTGTQASFLQLLGGDHGKVRRLDQLVAE
jgi:adenylosuccinate lyase